MKRTILCYVSCAALLLCLDQLWLAAFAYDFYPREEAILPRASRDLAVAAVFYLGYVTGIMKLVLWRNLKRPWIRTVRPAAVLGAVLFGFRAMIEHFSLEAWLLDTAWGAAITALVAAVARTIVLSRDRSNVISGP